MHILTATYILVAAKAGDTAKLAAARKTWYANANEIVDFAAVHQQILGMADMLSGIIIEQFPNQFR